MSRTGRIAVAGLVAAISVLLIYIVSESEAETRLPAREGGTLLADVSLGSGLSFDRGSLEIRSHDDADVRVVTRAWGWGKYAVDVQAIARDGDVLVEGSVEGPLHWAFAGPTVDVEVFVPQGYGVNARVDGGPLTLEDLSGPVVARSGEGGGSSITLRRSRGVARIAGRSSKIEIDELEGQLKVEAVGGKVSISNVQGTTVVSAQEGADMMLEGAHGKIHAASDYGNILMKGVVGGVDLETEDGSVRIADLDGRLRARSRHGDISVEFVANPSGRIETEAGSIDVEVPGSASFDLDARGQADGIDIARGLDFVRVEHPEDPLTPLIEQDVEDVTELGVEIAAEVHNKLSDRIRRYLAKRRSGEDGSETWDENWNWSWDDPKWRWRHHEWALERGSWGHWRDAPSEEGERVAGRVNGGGDELELRTQGGRIQLRD